jgi:hypothetical protein
MTLIFRFLLMFCICQQVFIIKLFAQDSTHAFDSLSKYSYLLLTGIKPHGYIANNLSPNDFIIAHSATGFFIKSGPKLFLVSAFHFLGSCDVYSGRRANEKDIEVIVVYHDTLGVLKTKGFSLENHFNKPCTYFFLQPDVDTIDVTGSFLDAHIYSIENLLPDNNKKAKLVNLNTYVCFGFPQTATMNYLFQPTSKGVFLYIDTAIASDKEDNIDRKINVDSLYSVITPGLPFGVSGSPIFELVRNKKKKKFFVFAGIQSGTNFKSNYSYIVKGEQLSNQLK